MREPSLVRVGAREILDSRGNPTVAAKIVLAGGAAGKALVPSGASTGTHEALELRDGDDARYLGKRVLKAVARVNDVIGPRIKGRDARGGGAIDRLRLDLDGTPAKTQLGVKAVFAGTKAFAKYL